MNNQGDHMEKYTLRVSSYSRESTMHFLYCNYKTGANTWKNEVNHEYHKINIFIKVDADIFKGEQVYTINNTGILYYAPFESHWGQPKYIQMAEYFEILIPRRFFDFAVGGTEIPTRLYESSDLFTMDTKNYHELLDRLFAVRSKFIKGESELYILGDIVNLLSFIESRQIPVKGLPRNKQLSSTVLTVMEYIDTHFLEISTVEQLSKQLHMSVSYICRLFRSQLSQTPYKYITDKKLEYAKNLLCQRSSVTEAALSAGFYGSSLFIQTFKKKFGITPGEYQKLYFSKN